MEAAGIAPADQIPQIVFQHDGCVNGPSPRQKDTHCGYRRKSFQGNHFWVATTNRAASADATLWLLLVDGTGRLFRDGDGIGERWNGIEARLAQGC